MIKDVFNSLMNDKVRTFFCWITFTITSMFIFLFFTVAMSDAVGVTMIRGKSDIPTILMVASVILCSVEIVFANDSYNQACSRRYNLPLKGGRVSFSSPSVLRAQLRLGAAVLPPKVSQSVSSSRVSLPATGSVRV